MTDKSMKPGWRRAKGDAILDGETAIEKLGWPNYRLDITYVEPWNGKRERWWKAVKASNGNRKL